MAGSTYSYNLTTNTGGSKKGNSVVVDGNLARILSTTAGISVFVGAAAVESITTMVENISKPQGDGKAYKRNGRVHVASAPGKFPTKDTGQLVASFDLNTTQKGEEITLSINSPYALDLELGTSRMASRPFIMRSVNEAFNTKLPAIYDKFIATLNANPGLFERLYLLYIIGLKDKLSDKAFANMLKRRGVVARNVI